MDNQEACRRGEDAAVRYLEGLGHTVVDRNWRCRLGEIDIVFLDGQTLVFCEVKTRLSERRGGPEAAVDLRKQHRITRLAAAYLARAGLHDVAVRFDVIAVRPSGDVARVRHLRGAFAMT